MERFETFTLLVAKLSRSIKRIKAEEMAKFQLKGVHVSCLHYLSMEEEMTAGELCERCEEDKAAVSRSLEQLEKAGYIACDRAPGRRYRAPLRLTEEGRSVCRAINERIEDIVAEASAGLREEERQTMYRALGQISANLEAICGEGKDERTKNPPQRDEKETV